MRRERLFLSSVSFFSSFGAARVVTHAIRDQRGPFRNMSVGGRHLHHLVFGIGGLLGCGYLWLWQLGTGMQPSSRAGSQSTALLYGTAAALTLDEFALWLDLQDVYWGPGGRASIDAVMIFGGLLSAGVWGAPFLRAIAHEVRQPVPA
jgi:hypothetical protein